MGNFYPTAALPAPDYQGRRAPVRHVPFNTRRALPRTRPMLPGSRAPGIPIEVPPELEPASGVARKLGFQIGAEEFLIGTLAFEAGFTLGMMLLDPNWTPGAGWTMNGICTTSGGNVGMVPVYYDHVAGYDRYYLNEYCGPRPASDAAPLQRYLGIGHWIIPVGSLGHAAPYEFRYHHVWEHALVNGTSTSWGDEPAFNPLTRVVPAPVASPFPWPDWMPSVAPATIPLGQPYPWNSPFPGVVPFPAVPSLPRTGPNGDPIRGPDPGVVPVSPPLVPPRPPGRGVKERKVRVHPVLQWTLRHVVNTVTERVDDIMCAVEALPRGLRPKPVWVPGSGVQDGGELQRPRKKGKANYRWTPKGWKHEVGRYRAPTVQEDLEALYRHWDKIDVGKFLICLAKNEIEDTLIGALGHAAGKRFPGIQSGPAL